jgi:hypothetical protein
MVATFPFLQTPRQAAWRAIFVSLPPLQRLPAIGAVRSAIKTSKWIGIVFAKSFIRMRQELEPQE